MLYNIYMYKFTFQLFSYVFYVSLPFPLPWFPHPHHGCTPPARSPRGMGNHLADFWHSNHSNSSHMSLCILTFNSDKSMRHSVWDFIWHSVRVQLAITCWRGNCEVGYLARRRGDEEEEGGAQAEIKSEDPHLSGGERWDKHGLMMTYE